MQVKKIYMDLREAKQELNRGRDVWVLESEAFKDPITIDIAYEDKEREFIEASKNIVEQQVKEAGRILQKLEDKIAGRNEVIEEYKDKLKEKDKKIEDLTKKLEKIEKEKVQLLQDAKKDRDASNTMDEQLKAIEKTIEALEKKATKQTRVFSGQTFVSGNGPSALTAINVPDGNYVVLRSTKIIESNEYVENSKLDIGGYYVHVMDKQFIPEYELIGTTKLDNPTATIDRTFTMIPQ